jgi:alpha-tubulin suppressor-like RCC1 family protein
MGYNAQGALGTGNDNSVHTPIEITNYVVAFAAGGNHSVFIIDYSEFFADLWFIGDNSYGEFGNGSVNNSSSPELNTNLFATGTGAIAAESDHTLILRGDNNSLSAMGRDDYGQLGDGTYNTTDVPVGGYLYYIQALAAGAYHSICLKDDGDLWLMGNNERWRAGRWNN